MDEKLSIVVPYRNRKEHLDKFLPAIESCRFLDGIDYEIVIVEQEDGKPFNRGKILNIGSVHSKNSTYYCFHDVDMLPISSDYSYVSIPTHLASEAEQFGFKLPYNGYFGGVTLFDKYSFTRINGYSNDYWGWGAEDDDVMFRCIVKGIRPARKIGRYLSLSHERVITQDLYNENLRKFFDFRNSPSIEFINQKIDEDGLNTLSYEIIEEKKLSNKAILIKVSI
ncbi:hypothetical protein EBU91_02190 [bacterium]|nr:hypothetical protein [bacterium]